MRSESADGADDGLTADGADDTDGEGAGAGAGSEGEATESEGTGPIERGSSWVTSGLGATGDEVRDSVDKLGITEDRAGPEVRAQKSEVRAWAAAGSRVMVVSSCMLMG